jgi:hypothetical protein
MVDNAVLIDLTSKGQDSLTKLSCDNSSKYLAKFRLHALSEYPGLYDMGVYYLICLRTRIFSDFCIERKDVEPELRSKLTTLQPDA